VGVMAYKTRELRGKKTKVAGTQEIEIEFLEVGDTLKFWCNRNQQNRWGKVHAIGTKFIHVIVNHKLRKIPVDDEALALVRGNESFNIVGNR
jgi:hypothetical protein